MGHCDKVAPEGKARGQGSGALGGCPVPLRPVSPAEAFARSRKASGAKASHTGLWKPTCAGSGHPASRSEMCAGQLPSGAGPPPCHPGVTWPQPSPLGALGSRRQQPQAQTSPGLSTGQGPLRGRWRTTPSAGPAALSSLIRGCGKITLHGVGREAIP